MATDAVAHEEPLKEGGEKVNGPEVEWTAENEVNLFKAISGRRPVDLMQREISSQAIWDHLEEMYDMEALNENTPLPKQFASTVEFQLPSEYEEMKEKLAIEDSLSTSSVADIKEEKDKTLETEAPKSVSSVKSEGSSTKTPKPKPDKETPKESTSIRKESESKGDQETPKTKKPRQSRSDSLIKTASNNSSNKKRRQNN